MDLTQISIKKQLLMSVIMCHSATAMLLPSNISNTLKSFINTDVWVQVHHHVANGTVLIVEYVRYYIIARAFKNSVVST